MISGNRPDLIASGQVNDISNRPIQFFLPIKKTRKYSDTSALAAGNDNVICPCESALRACFQHVLTGHYVIRRLWLVARLWGNDLLRCEE